MWCCYVFCGVNVSAVTLPAVLFVVGFFFWGGGLLFVCLFGGFCVCLFFVVVFVCLFFLFCFFLLC